MILREILLQSSLIAGTCFLISIPISSGMLLRFISTLNNAPLHAALASNDATPTSETAFLFPSVINGGSTFKSSRAKHAVSNGI